ncbi:MAG: hypothetical protein ACFFEY_18455 [Candidatus Thorarchaeota archaeon]
MNEKRSKQIHLILTESKKDKIYQFAKNFYMAGREFIRHAVLESKSLNFYGDLITVSHIVSPFPMGRNLRKLHTSISLSTIKYYFLGISQKC